MTTELLLQLLMLNRTHEFRSFAGEQKCCSSWEESHELAWNSLISLTKSLVKPMGLRHTQILMNCWRPKVGIFRALILKKSVPGKDNTRPCTLPADARGTVSRGDGALPYSKGTGKIPWEIPPVQVFLSTTNPTVYVLHLRRSPTSSVDGEIIPKSFEC